MDRWGRVGLEGDGESVERPAQRLLDRIYRTGVTQPPAEQTFPQLTTRELEVLEHLAGGRRNGEIATEPFLIGGSPLVRVVLYGCCTGLLPSDTPRSYALAGASRADTFLTPRVFRRRRVRGGLTHDDRRRTGMRRCPEGAPGSSRRCRVGRRRRTRDALAHGPAGGWSSGFQAVEVVLAACDIARLACLLKAVHCLVEVGPGGG